MEHRVSVKWLLEHLHLIQDTLCPPSCGLGNWASFFLSPPICPMCLLLFDSTDHYIVTIVYQECSDYPTLLWLNSIALIYHFKDQILEVYWLSQNCAGRFHWISFILLRLLATLEPKKFVFYCLGIFDGPKYCLSCRLCLIMLYISKKRSFSQSTPDFLSSLFDPKVKSIS